MSTFVGRSEQLAAVRAGVAAALRGAGPAVVVSGEAGIGKTALVAEALSGLPDVEPLCGGAVVEEWQPPFGPWAEIARGAVAALGAGPARTAAGAGVGPLARLAPELGTPTTGVADSAQARAQLLDALGAVLLAQALRRPLVLVVDDLQWAEADAQLATRTVGRRLPQPGLALVVTVREPDPDRPGANGAELATTLAALARRPGLCRVPLDGLDAEEVGRLSLAFSERPLPAGFAAAIRDSTAGNPLFATEVIRGLVEASTLELREGRWSSDVSIGALGLPPGVRDVVRQRVARLGPPARDLLAVAAALGGELTMPIAQLLLDRPRTELLDALDEVLGAGFLVAGGPGGGYRFRHVIVRATLAAAANPDRAADHHLRVVAALERLHAADLDAVAGELAHQYHAAGVADPGVAHCRTAATQAGAAHAHRLAARYLEMAADLTPPAQTLDHARLAAGRALALADAGDLAAAGAQIEVAVTGLAAAGASAKAV